MRMKNFVQQIASELEKILEKEETLVNDHEGCVSLESSKFIFKLKKLLAAYAESNNETVQNNLTLFINLLKGRERFVGTDVLYAHNIYSHANRISVRIAELLGEATNRHPFEFLFSKLAPAQFNFEDKINSMVLSDDNTQLINVLTCLEQAQARVDKGETLDLAYTHAGSKSVPMTNAEKWRVINFNSQAQRYYTEIQKGTAESKRKAHNDLRKNIGYRNNTVTYGEEGIKLLKSLLYLPEEDLTREKLIKKLLLYPHHMREKYLKNVPLAVLKKILCGSSNIKDAVKNKSFYTGVENHDSALMFAFVILYRKELHARGSEYSGYGGSWTGFSKLQKDKASLIPKNFLENGGRLSEYEADLNKAEHIEHKPALTNGWDTLSAINNQIVNLGNSSYVAEIQKLQTQMKLSPKLEKRNWFGY